MAKFFSSQVVKQVSQTIFCKKNSLKIIFFHKKSNNFYYSPNHKKTNSTHQPSNCPTFRVTVAAILNLKLNEINQDVV